MSKQYEKRDAAFKDWFEREGGWIPADHADLEHAFNAGWEARSETQFNEVTELRKALEEDMKNRAKVTADRRLMFGSCGGSQ